MKLTSWNVNGLKSALGKGFAKWLERESFDIVSLQETKFQEKNLTDELRALGGYKVFFHCAKRPGYSGVAVLTKKDPLEWNCGIGIEEIDNEGRVLVLRFEDFTLLNCYFPNSGRDHLRLPYKLFFCKELKRFADRLRAQGEKIIIAGDYNIAHQEIDLRNPKQNMNNAGFLPQEREWMSHFLNEGYADVFREKVPEGGHYTWWSYRPGVREKNIGWRLDYHCVSEDLRDQVKAVSHQPLTTGSDHCPVVLELVQ